MKRAPTFVYFLRPIGMAGPIKIGCSAVPEARLQTYMPWAPFPLEIAARLPSTGYELEYRFHAAFAHLRTHHEWFSADPALTAAIDAITAGTFDPDTLPPPQRFPTAPDRPRWSAESRLGASFSHRLYHLERRGVAIPHEVKHAARRYTAGPHFRDYGPHDPKDAETVLAFLAQHYPRPRSSKAAAEQLIAQAAA